MQGEHLVLAAFARQRFVLMAEEANSYGGKEWQETKHNLDLIFERDGRAYGIEVKNTLGYLDVSEFVTKIRLARHIGKAYRRYTGVCRKSAAQNLDFGSVQTWWIRHDHAVSVLSVDA